MQGSQATLPGADSQARLPRKRFPGKVPKRFQARFPGNRFPSKGSQARVPSKRFPSKVPRKRFCKHGFQEPFSSKARFPGTCFSKHNKVPRIGFVQTSVSRKKFPRRGVQERFPASWFPSNISRKRFPSKVPSRRFPGTGAHTRFPRTGSQVRFPGRGSQATGSQEQVPKQVSQ